MQNYIAASIDNRKTRYNVQLIAPGNGKTFIILLLCRTYTARGKKVYVLTSSEFLAEQMRQILRGYINPKLVIISHKTLPR